MKHSMSQYIYYCKWCGQSMEDLISLAQENCDGTKGVYHIQYLRVQREVGKILNPVLNRLGIK